ncbi:MAG: hypothetical protein ACI9P5_003769 [Saprospiraceae bacterium]|jgi:hypothetical protein
MSSEIIEAKRRKLNNEIFVAQEMFENNIENIDVSDYLPSISSFMPKVFSSIKRIPGELEIKNKISSQYNTSKSVIFEAIAAILKSILK